MSASFEAKARQGTQELVDEAERMLQKAAAESRPGGLFSFPETVYYLPVILAATSRAVDQMGTLHSVVRELRGSTANTSLRTLQAAEALEALRSTKGRFISPISDTQVRSWGVQLAEGHLSGIAVILGQAKNNVVALTLIEKLLRSNILCLLGGTGLLHQLQEEQRGAGAAKYIVPLGSEPTSSVHAAGFLARSAMKLAGHKPGMWADITSYCKRRTPGFVLALGELEARELALALALRALGFPLITDGSGANESGNLEHVFPIPFEGLAGRDDAEKARNLIEECIAIRGMKPKSFDVDLPVAYGPAYEDEVISDTDLQVQFGGNSCRAFELLQKADSDKLMDGRIEIIGPTALSKTHLDLGIVVKVAGEKLETDFEPYLERQIHEFLSYVDGLEHAGGQDRVMIRLSKAAASKGLGLESLGKLIHARFHQEFGKALAKVEIMLITDAKCHADWLAQAQTVYERRRKRLSELTDDQVDVFYVCTNCRTFAPNNVSIIAPQRVSPCGRCNWLDARAGHALNPAGVRRPIKIGKPIDIKKGIWEGTNQYARIASRGRIKEVALYSIMQNPMSACGDFECIVMLIPEANGVMVVSHEDTMLPTPTGLTIETFASIAAGEQIPGVVGVGRNHLLSTKFLAADGGFKRVVWMSSSLKRAMAEELAAVCAREGDPQLMGRIADEHNATTVAGLVHWLEEHKHPALQMEKMY